MGGSGQVKWACSANIGCPGNTSHPIHLQHEQVPNEATLWLPQGELGSTVFSSEFKITQVLVGVEHVEPMTDTYKHGKEKIDWSYKPVCQVLELWLKSRTNEGANQFKCDHLDLVVTIDHDKGHSRVTTCNFITCVRSPENREWEEEEYACTIGMPGVRRIMPSLS
jgi:hypothetical protein